MSEEMKKEFNASLGLWFGKIIDDRLEDLIKVQFIILKKIRLNEGINQNE